MLILSVCVGNMQKTIRNEQQCAEMYDLCYIYQINSFDKSHKNAREMNVKKQTKQKKTKQTDREIETHAIIV